MRKFFFAETEVLLTAFLTMDGKVNRDGRAPVKECEQIELEAKDILVGNMVKYATDAFNAEACLLQSRIIYDVALGLFRILGILFPENSKETYCHAKKQGAPVHRLTVEHTVVAVLAG